MTLYRRMLQIRILEQRLLALCREGHAGDLHFSTGQEAIAVGVCAALAPTDHICTHHRTIAHALSKGIELYPLVAELLGRKTGLNGGRAGEMHLHDERTRFDFSFQLVGTCVPVAAGLGWAIKYHHKTDDIVAVFFGDAATSNAQFHEGATIAAVQKVPLLLICENNHIAGNVRPDRYMPTKTVADRMTAYGIDARTIDGNDVREVQTSAEAAVAMVRRHGKPFMLEMDTTRLGYHKIGMGDCRSKEELSDLYRRDPICIEGNRLGVGQKAQVDIESEVAADVDAAIARAMGDPVSEML